MESNITRQPADIDMTPLEALFAKGQLLTYRKGEVIIRPQDEPLGVYYIKTGIVRTYSINSHGEDYVHILNRPGELFSVSWLIGQPKKHLYFDAITECTVYRLDRAAVLRAMSSNGPLALAMFTRLAEQYSAYSSRIDNLEYRYAAERLAYRLLSLASRLGERRPDGIAICGVTQREIARTINVTPESLNRELDKMKRKGLLESRPRLFVLKDLDGLAKLVDKNLTPAFWNL